MVTRYAIKPGILAIFVTLIIILGASPNKSGAQTPAPDYSLYDWRVHQLPGPTLWRALASSSDGTKLVAACGCIYTSTDSGATWTLRTNAGERNWRAIASSADGTKLIAAESGGYIYTSTDSGATWTQQTNAGQHYWQTIATSSDGTKLVAADGGATGTYGGYIYTSSDSGVTWTQQTNSGLRSWSSVASSSDGIKLVAGEFGFGAGYIYTSTDSGATWTQQTSPGKSTWTSVASSSDGAKLVVAGEDGKIYTSTDFGASWKQQATYSIKIAKNTESPSDNTKYGSVIINNVVFTDYWYVASSSDGTRLVAVDYGYGWGGSIYTSTDSGSTWTYQTNLDAGYWVAVAMSSDGTTLLAAEDGGHSYDPISPGGYVHTSTDSGVTWKQQTNVGDNHSWRAIASSSDGTNLIALDVQELPSVPFDGYYKTDICTSTDSGVTWKQQTSAGGQNWFAVASSSDGTKIVAVDFGSTYTRNGGYIYTSTDSGATWTLRDNAGAHLWDAVASSSNGAELVAVDYGGDFGGHIYTSKDFGATWIRRGNAGRRSWDAVASSSDGKKLIAAEYGGYIYTSTNSGATWKQLTSAGQRHWWSVASSSDGDRLVAAEYGGYIYVSADSGNTWTPQTGASIQTWGPLASSSDGSKLIATSAHLIWTGSGPAPKPPVIDIPASTTFTASTATLGAIIESDGGYSITAAGIAYGTIKNPGISGSRKITSTTSGAFTVNVAGLASNTLYHFRGYATNLVGTTYTDDAQFTTAPDAPRAKAASNVAVDSFTANWTVPPGPATTNQYRLDVATNPRFMVSSFVTGYKDLTVSGTGAAVTGLSSGTYYYRVRAINGGGTSANSNAAKALVNVAHSPPTSPGGGNSGFGSFSVSGGSLTITSGASFSSEGCMSVMVTSGASLAFPVASVIGASAGPDQEVSELAQVKLSGSNSMNISKADASYLWTQLDGPPVTLSDPTALETGFIAPEAGFEGKSLRFQLSVAEADGAKSTDNCIINVVKDIAPPTAHAGSNQTVAGAQIVVLDGSKSSAPDAGTLSYSWRQVSGLFTLILSDLSAAQPTFVAPMVYNGGGSFVFELTVTDQIGLRSRDTCIVNVISTVTPPIARAGTNRTVPPGSSVVLDGSGSVNEEGATLSYTWRQIAGPPATLSDPAAVKPEFVAPAIDALTEDLVFELTVTDSAGLLDKARVVITVAGASGTYTELPGK